MVYSLFGLQEFQARSGHSVNILQNELVEFVVIYSCFLVYRAYHFFKILFSSYSLFCELSLDFLFPFIYWDFIVFPDNFFKLFL